MDARESARQPVPPFDRRFFSSPECQARIGKGELGGKARGLVFIREVLEAGFDRERFPQFRVVVPRMAVVATEMFDAFMKRNDLHEVAASSLPDDRIAHAFQKADLPVEMLGDLRALIEEAHQPLAIRSSSMLEDALYRPFAGVYGTKMIPNNQHDPNERFRRLTEAIKFVYASTFFSAARSYIRATDRTSADEKMAVIVQEVVGRRADDRFYPCLSGVARSYNFYPSGSTRPEDGVVSLALGLGKTIVDGGVCWSYSPTRPQAPPPYGSTGELLKNSQVRFWAVNMGRPPAYDPIRETEYLVQADLTEAERDGTLPLLASTYDARSDRLSPGLGFSGPRVLNFAPLLQLRELPLNDLVRDLLRMCEKALSEAVEIEFALNVERGSPPTGRLGFLQVRPMVVSSKRVEIEDGELEDPSLVVGSRSVMGNGVDDSIADVVYVKRAGFEARFTPAIVGQLERINAPLQREGRPYLLIGFGRWGSSDPWLGIPVEWGQISGARAIVEATLPSMNVEPSQGSHFFHNISSFRVSYFMVHHAAKPGIDWDWLDAQPAAEETEHVRRISLDARLLVKVDGRSGRGGIWRRDRA